MAELTHILFDFFGTLVAYSPSLVEQGYPRSHAVLADAGACTGYDAFLAEWSATVGEFEDRALATLDEFSMDQVCDAFLRRVLPRTPQPGDVVRFRDTYLEEWSKGVTYLPGVTEMLDELSKRFTLVLVTNTHHPELVHGHLRAIDATRCFAAIVTSVEHGRRKPSPCIFVRALELTGGRPETALYVGDSHAADYLGATGAGLRPLLIDADGRHDVPLEHRLAHVLEARARVLRGGVG